ncbi:MAG: hypothetical protein R3Y43_05585 [Alphaproteobacteria bacterium]
MENLTKVSATTGVVFDGKDSYVKIRFKKTSITIFRKDDVDNFDNWAMIQRGDYIIYDEESKKLIKNQTIDLM